jgi:hypothetical protein
MPASSTPPGAASPPVPSPGPRPGGKQGRDPVSRQELGSGALFLTFGLAAILLGRDQPMGTAVRMGPGYFPTVLGALLALVGVAVIVRALVRPPVTDPVDRPPFAWKPLLLVTGATALFGVLLRGAGLVPATIALVLVSARASARFSWRASLPLAVVSAVFCALVFIKALGVPMPIFGSWLGG